MEQPQINPPRRRGRLVSWSRDTPPYPDPCEALQVQALAPHLVLCRDSDCKDQVAGSPGDGRRLPACFPAPLRPQGSGPQCLGLASPPGLPLPRAQPPRKWP